MGRGRMWSVRAWAIAGIAAAAVAIGGAGAAPVEAQVRITLPGAGPLYYPNLLTQLPLGRTYLAGTDYAHGAPLSVLGGYDLLNHVTGENWFPGSSPQVVNYPASMGILSGSLAAPGVNQAVEMGRAALHDQIRNAAAGADPVVIAGLSQGTLVINRELAYLATHPDTAPRPDQLSFAMFGGPETGLFDIYLPAGLTLPIVDYTAHRLPESQYDVAVVFRQYDGWADPPDRPWNLLAVANAVAGALTDHNSSALDSRPDAVEISRTTSALGGTTTTYMVPTPTLPLLSPLQHLGVPADLVGSLNAVLKPVVDAGYSRLTPDAGPFFSQGRLRGPATPCAANCIPASASVRQSAPAASSRATRSPAALHRPAASPRVAASAARSAPRGQLP